MHKVSIKTPIINIKNDLKEIIFNVSVNLTHFDNILKKFPARSITQSIIYHKSHELKKQTDLDQF